MRWLSDLCNRQRLFRRSVLVWACCLITVSVDRATQPEALISMSPSAGSVVVAVIGILSVVIGFYFKHRAENDRDKG